jgi:hypothetical protein
MTVRELKQRMTLAEFRAWQAYGREDPFGLDRGDYQVAMVIAALRNLFRGERDDPIDPLDVMPRWGRAAAPQPTGPTLAQIQALIARVNAAYT